MAFVCRTHTDQRTLKHSRTANNLRSIALVSPGTNIHWQRKTRNEWLVLCRTCTALWNEVRKRFETPHLEKHTFSLHLFRSWAPWTRAQHRHSARDRSWDWSARVKKKCVSMSVFCVGVRVVGRALNEWNKACARENENEAQFRDERES